MHCAGISKSHRRGCAGSLPPLERLLVVLVSPEGKEGRVAVVVGAGEAGLGQAVPDRGHQVTAPRGAAYCAPLSFLHRRDRTKSPSQSEILNDAVRGLP